MDPVVRTAFRTAQKPVQKVSRYLRSLPKRFFLDSRAASAPARALAWLRASESGSGGISAHSENPYAYPEVTGYLIPTLLAYGERDFALRCLEWLYCIQRADGSYTSPEGEPYIFDTAQVLRGLLAGTAMFPPAAECARRAAGYLCDRMIDDGRGGFGTRYHGEIPESVHLYALPPLILASEMLREPEYRRRAENCLGYYLHHPDFLRMDDLTHFLAYQLEALIDTGHPDLALPALSSLQEFQKDDGSVRGTGPARWVCTTGLAQLAVCWYRTGQWAPADAAMGWLDRHQEASGGFTGSIGRGATYFPDAEIPWAVKFYLDAHALRVMSFFDRSAGMFPSSVPSGDGRFFALASCIRPHDTVLEAGCGKGRFLAAVKEKFPGTRCHGVDISGTLLSFVPKDIATKKGPLENIPCPDNYFDVVFSVEAVEHSANPQAAVSEMARVAKPGGWIVVIDKQQSRRGSLKCLPWERWPERESFERLFNRWCDHVSAEPVGYDGKPADGLMVAWKGQKRSALSGDDWTGVILPAAGRDEVIRRVRHNQLSPWGREILLSTGPGEKVLEVGCGTGEISLLLAQAGRDVTVLDFSGKNLDFVRACASELGVPITAVHADATQELPFGDGGFDCVWNSGLLEHFPKNERRKMLVEFARVSDDRVIVAVPNASSLAYHTGKELLESRGNWEYGSETPAVSLREDFGAAGIRLQREYSVGIRHATSFLPAGHPLRTYLEGWLGTAPEQEMGRFNQGYLLIAIGSKRGRE